MLLLILYLFGLIAWLILISTYDGEIDNLGLITAVLSWVGVVIFLVGVTAESLEKHRRLDM